MSASSPSSRVQSPNVTISSNLISPYGPPLNGYRMAAQQPGGSVSYITNSAAGFINNSSQLQMANMAAMQQYQDPAALQRAAVQQNTYYPYISLNTNPMRR